MKSDKGEGGNEKWSKGGKGRNPYTYKVVSRKYK